MKNKEKKLFTLQFNQDLNFFKYPLWFPQKKNVSFAQYDLEHKIFCWTNKNGFRISSTGIMNRTDILLMYQLLMKSQHNNFIQHLEISPYKILKECNIGINKQAYKVLLDSLDKWKSVNIRFDGNFYTGKDFGSWALFGILNEAEYIRDEKLIKIEFNNKFLSLIRKSEFTRIINIQCYKTIKSQLALRLFEVLTKQFSMKQKTMKIFLDKIPDLIGMIPKKTKTKNGEKFKFYDSYIKSKTKIAIEYLNNLFSDEDKLRQYKIYNGFITDFYIYTNEDDKKKAVFKMVREVNIKKKQQKPKTKKINLDKLKLTKEQKEIKKWLIKNNVSTPKIYSILQMENLKHDFPYVKKLYQTKEYTPGWIVSAFEKGYFTKRTDLDNIQKDNIEQMGENYLKWYKGEKN